MSPDFSFAYKNLAIIFEVMVMLPLVLCVLFTAKVFKFQKILKSQAKASGVLCQWCHKRNDPLAGEVDYLNPPSI